MNHIVALQMDAIASINPDSDTTFQLGLEAQRRGHRLFHYTPDQLAWADGTVTANGHFLSLVENGTPHYAIDKPKNLALDAARFVLMRQDPPFDMAYISATYLLEQLPDSTRVLNNPVAVRNWPEKLSILNYPDAIPPTLVSREVDAIHRFRKTHGAIVIKPLYGYGGEDIFLAHPDDPNFETILSLLLNRSREPLMMQAFLPAVKHAEKRVLLIDGRVAAVINRVPPDAAFRANLCLGGTAAAAELTKREQEVCCRIGNDLKHQDIFLAGLDLIDGYLTEINVTSPTGFVPAQALYDTNLAKQFWDAAGSE